jgi:hypothetical protein
MSVVSAPPQDAQVKRLYEVAQEYRAKGYRVTVGPSQHELPEFLRGFEPDLIVTSDEDRAVVEVKPRRALIGSPAFSRMAAAVEQQPGWRFELDLVPSDADLEQRLPDSTDVARVRSLLAQANALRESGIAIVPAVAAVENAMMIALDREGLDLPSPYPSAAMKTLFAYGLLSREAYDSLDAAMRIRDDVAHGRRTDVDPDPWLAAIEPIVQELLTGEIS